MDRLSVGGRGDESVKIERAKDLARKALGRLASQARKGAEMQAR